MPDHRAHFDFDIRFANGGGLTGTGFRLDVPSADSRSDLGRLLVHHLGLALVESVEHAGWGSSRSSTAEAAGSTGRGSSGPSTHVVDLSHPIRAGLVTYPGLPAPVITPHLTREDSRAKYAAGTEFAMDVITMIGNTGTYLDTPFHRYADGRDLAGLDLSTLVGLRAEVFHLQDSWNAERRGIRAETLADRAVRRCSRAAAHRLGPPLRNARIRCRRTISHRRGRPVPDRCGRALVGIDSVNIDDTESGGERPAHTLLLGAGVHVVEHLTNLGDLPPWGARFTAAPPAIEGFGTFPVRAFAELPAG